VPAVLLRRVSNGSSFSHWLRDSSRSSKTVWLLLSEVNSLSMRRKDHDSTYCNSRYHKVSSHYDLSRSTRHFQPHSLCFSMPFTCILFCLHGVSLKVNDIHILLPPMHDSPTFQNRTRHLSHSTYRQFSNIWIRFGIAIAATLTSLVDILHYHSLCWTTFTHKNSQAVTVLTLAIPVPKISQLAVPIQVLRHAQTLLRPPSKHSDMTSGLRGATRPACEHDDIPILSDHLGKAILTASPEHFQSVVQTCLKDSTRRSSTKVMAYLIEQGADATQVTGMTLIDTINDTLPSLGALELLVDHGRDINSRGLARGMPELWFVVRDVDLVRWCLDHGADVDPVDDTLSGAKKHRKPILEVTAAEGNIEVFELL
jgi:hypothetical protein